VVSDVRTLKRSKGVAVGVGNGGDEGAGARGDVVVRRAFVTASLSLLIARHDGLAWLARGAVGRGDGQGERCDPLARGFARRTSGAAG